MLDTRRLERADLRVASVANDGAHIGRGIVFSDMVRHDCCETEMNWLETQREFEMQSTEGLELRAFLGFLARALPPSTSARQWWWDARGR